MDTADQPIAGSEKAWKRTSACSGIEERRKACGNDVLVHDHPDFQSYLEGIYCGLSYVPQKGMLEC